jgi:hypothetical protein
MHTVLLQSKPRKDASGKLSISMEAMGDNDVKDSMRHAINNLVHYPASNARRSLIDMLNIIEQFNLEIKYTEHFYTEDDLEAWLFILQG